MICTLSCRQDPNSPIDIYREDYIATALQSIAPIYSATFKSNTDSSVASKIVAFAKTQLGVPYKSCSIMPEGGFDCSGFINYVFNHFNIKVPRSSVDFTNTGTDVAMDKCQPADLILFTGTDSRVRKVGHIGLIVSNDGRGNITFIQSTSGAAYGVVISPLNDSYRARFVKVIRMAATNN